MKFSIKIIVLLIVVNGLLTYMHYSQANDALAKEPITNSYEQEIEVINRLDALYVRHHFNDLAQKRTEILWPENSINRKCFQKEEFSCERLDEGATAFLEGESSQQSISYEIPKRVLLKERVLFKDSFVNLHKSNVTSTIFHMTDETGIGGFWVNGLKKVGNKKMELIDYSLFQGAGGITDLYWQKKELPVLYNGDKLTVYGEVSNGKQFEGVNDALKTIKARHSTIVMNSGSPSIHSERFIISKDANVDNVAAGLLMNNIATRYSVPHNESLVVEMIASILGEKPLGTAKSRTVYNQLVNSLSVDELTQLKSLVTSMSGENMHAVKLDGLIGKVTGFRTQFIKKNSSDKAGDYPFLIEDPREIRIGETAYPEIRIILKDGKTLYPIKSILGHVGYTVSTNERSIYIESSTRKFRFPKKDLFYVYNEKKYELISMPFELIEGEIYFDENWFKRLFLLGTEKTNDSITLINLTTLIEEVGK